MRPCVGPSKLGAGLQHPLTDIKEHLACGSPPTHVPDWSNHTLSVDKAEPSGRDCQGDHHHQPDSVFQGRSQPVASHLALTRTWFCTAQPHRETASVLSGGKKKLPTAHNDSLLISQTASPNCIVTLWQARTRQHH